MRIISGKFRGRKLTDAKNLKTLRPTTDMAREALFNLLTSAKSIQATGFKLQGAKIVDLCCGSGAIAFEALSRGAESALLIDNNLAHLSYVKKNIEVLQLENHSKTLCLDVKKLPKNSEFFDLIFLDPPYDGDYKSMINSLLANGWMQKNTLLVVEFKSKNSLPEIDNLVQIDLRSYGITSFAFFTLTI